MSGARHFFLGRKRDGESVTLVSGSFFPREGGAERQMREVLGSLTSRGVVSSVVTQVLAGQPRRSVVDGIHVHRVGSVQLFRHAPRLGQAYFALSSFVAVVVAHPSRVVSLQFGTATLAARLFTRIWGVDHIVRLTGGGTDRYRSEPVARSSSWSGRIVVGFALGGRRVTVVAPAAHLLEDLRLSFPEHSVPIERVPNGVPLHIEKSDIAPGPRAGVIWYARSGSETSLEFFYAIASMCPDLSFTVIGQLINAEGIPNVTPIGWVQEPATVLAGAKVLLNTSLNEGMPNTALQALSVGCRVLGARNAGLLELSRDFPDAVHLYDYHKADDAATNLMSAHSLASPDPMQVPTREEALDSWISLLQGDVRDERV